MKTIQLPSGAELKIDLPTFAVSKAFYQAVLAEGVGIKISSIDHVENVIKDAFCTLLSSKRVEAAFEPCLKKALYNNVHITDSVFEPVEARGDYLKVCFEVARENIMPFMKDLYAQYAPVLESLKKPSQA